MLDEFFFFPKRYVKLLELEQDAKSWTPLIVNIMDVHFLSLYFTCWAANITVPKCMLVFYLISVETNQIFILVRMIVYCRTLS